MSSQSGPEPPSTNPSRLPARAAVSSTLCGGSAESVYGRLVTGAGGSIGCELVKQISRLGRRAFAWSTRASSTSIRRVIRSSARMASSAGARVFAIAAASLVAVYCRIARRPARLRRQLAFGSHTGGRLAVTPLTMRDFSRRMFAPQTMSSAPANRPVKAS